MGRRTAAWKAALWGGLCGTLPDLDVFIDHGDPISNMTLHRTESHSLFFLTLASPLVAWLASRIHRGQGGFSRWWLAVWLALVTHPLLDLMTVYGTQLLLPFNDHPYGVGSVFVIDPLFTLPLVAGLAIAIARGARGLRWNRAALVFSTAYLAAGVLVQAHVRGLAAASLEHAGIESRQVLVTPTPFNIVLWRVLAMTEGGYAEGFHSLLDPDGEIAFTRHPSDAALFRRHAANRSLARIAWFSHGFYGVAETSDGVLIRDLRMGQEPHYTFSFIVPWRALGVRDPGDAPPAGPGKPSFATAPGPLEDAPGPTVEIAARQLPMRVDIAAALPLLWRRLLGHPTSLRLDDALAPQGGS
jgi:inner membrane protein